MAYWFSAGNHRQLLSNRQESILVLGAAKDDFKLLLKMPLLLVWESNIADVWQWVANEPLVIAMRTVKLYR